MKKSMVALATLATVGAASAQSSVTLFGVIDATYQSVKHDGGPRVSRMFPSGGLSTSRLGFRGTEDLGGGLSAIFHAEMGFNADDGTGQTTSTNNQVGGASPAGAVTFNRRSVVGLKSNSWGEVNAGRDYSPMLWNLTAFDPFTGNGIGSLQNYTQIITNLTNVRVSNSLGYFLPGGLGGLYGEGRAFLGENPTGSATEDDGRGYAVRLGYKAGPFDVAVATGRTTYAIGDHEQKNMGGRWDLGMVKLMGNVSRDETGAAKGRGWMLGANIAVGEAGVVRTSISQYTIDLKAGGAEDRSRKYAVGYVHNLSKRTAVFGTYARVSNGDFAARPVVSGTGAPRRGGSSSGFDIGLRHSF